MISKRAHWSKPLVATCVAALAGCADANGMEPRPRSTSPDVDSDPPEVLVDRSSTDGVANASIDEATIARLTPLQVELLPLASDAPSTPVAHADDPALDFVPPAPVFTAAWSTRTLDSLDLDSLELEVSNRSHEARTFALTVLVDRGTTRAETHTIGTITVPPQASIRHRVQRESLPQRLAGRRLAGLLQLSLHDGRGETLVLPGLYAVPGEAAELAASGASSHELMTAEDLERALAQDGRWREPGAALSRVVEWEPEAESGTAPLPADPDGVATASLAAHEYTTCVRWQAQTIDSGHGEDRISWGDGAGGLITAYGVRIRVRQGDWYQDLDTSPASGCVTWTSPHTGEFSARVYAYVEDVNHNAIRYHDAGDAAFGSYPGSTYSVLVSSYLPSTSSTTYLNVGSWAPRYTAMATASMVSRYYPGFTSDTQIHMADDLSGGGSSAHHCSGGSCLYANGDAYVRLQISASDDHRRRKFITAHELGHARAILAQERLEANATSGLASGTCSNGSGYSMVTREWNAIGLREGYAHFVATWTYNDSSEENGWIRWFNTTYDVEANNPSATGGYIGNNCGGVTNGHSVNLDVLRTLWDWTTPVGDASAAERADVAESYERMVRTTPASDEYWDAFEAAAEIESSAAEHDALLDWGEWNGLFE